MTTAGGLWPAVAEFAGYLGALVGGLDQDRGWCGVFLRRDPEGMRACVDGREEAPWDVVRALLDDFAARHGPALAAREAARARALYTAALAAHDALPGARERLGDRLDVMLEEQRYAARRRAELARRLHAAPPGGAPAIERDLAWAQDDHARAGARCAELRARLDRLDRLGRSDRPEGPDRPDRFTETDLTSGATGVPGGGGRREAGGPEAAAAADRTHPGGPVADVPAAADLSSPPAARAASDVPGLSPVLPASAAPAAPAVPADPGVAAVPGARAARPRGARFAGAGTGEGSDGRDGAAFASAALPVPLAVPPAAAAPRGARFAGSPVAPQAAPREQAPDEETQEAVAHTVAVLLRLRGAGRGGEAHMVLVEAASWPVARLPPLAAELRRVGLDADWSTLLWEAASLPIEHVVVLADTLMSGGFAADGARLLREAVARPPHDIGHAVLALTDEGRRREAHALLGACVGSRTPEDAARCAGVDPHRLVPLLVRTAQSVSEAAHHDLVHALRVAGLAG